MEYEGKIIELERRVKTLVQVCKEQLELITNYRERLDSLEQQVSILSDRLEIKIKQDNLRQ